MSSEILVNIDQYRFWEPEAGASLPIMVRGDVGEDGLAHVSVGWPSTAALGADQVR